MSDVRKLKNNSPASALAPAKLYGIVAIAEAITWTLLIAGMVLKYTGLTDAGVRFAGPVHGFVFLCYCVSTVLIWYNNSWSVKRGGLGLLSAVIPYLTIPFEVSSRKDGALDGVWRYRDTDDEPKGAIAKLFAAVVRNPAISVVILGAGVVVVFGVLIVVGPPVPMG